jgi:hypothetical protein
MSDKMSGDLLWVNEETPLRTIAFIQNPPILFKKNGLAAVSESRIPESSFIVPFPEERKGQKTGLRLGPALPKLTGSMFRRAPVFNIKRTKR